MSKIMNFPCNYWSGGGPLKVDKQVFEGHNFDWSANVQILFSDRIYILFFWFWLSQQWWSNTSSILVGQSTFCKKGKTKYPNKKCATYWKSTSETGSVYTVLVWTNDCRFERLNKSHITFIWSHDVYHYSHTIIKKETFKAQILNIQQKMTDIYRVFKPGFTSSALRPDVTYESGKFQFES